MRNGLRALAAMAMLFARTWVQVPPITSGVFLLQQGLSTEQSNHNARFCAMCLYKLAPSYQGAHVKHQMKNRAELRSQIIQKLHWDNGCYLYSYMLSRQQTQDMYIMLVNCILVLLIRLFDYTNTCPKYFIEGLTLPMSIIRTFKGR